MSLLVETAPGTVLSLAESGAHRGWIATVVCDRENMHGGHLVVDDEPDEEREHL